MVVFEESLEIFFFINNFLFCIIFYVYMFGYWVVGLGKKIVLDLFRGLSDYKVGSSLFRGNTNLIWIYC